MPVYNLNNQIYDIPDSVVADFEKDNPTATISYKNGENIYDIPVSEKNGFLKQFPNAVAYTEDSDGETKKVGDVIVGGTGTQEEADAIFEENARKFREMQAPIQAVSSSNEIDRLKSIRDTAQKEIDASSFTDRFFNDDTKAAVAARNAAEEALENHLIDEIVNSDNAPVIDSCTRDMFNSLDIPVPDRFNSPIASDGLMEKLIACISILSNKINNLSMKKVFNLALLCTLLNRASFEAEEDVVSVSCQDLNNIENHLVALSESIASKETEISTLNATIDERNSEINSLNARIDELNAQIVALQKAPAVDPEEVFEEGEDVVSCVDILNSLS